MFNRTRFRTSVETSPSGVFQPLAPSLATSPNIAGTAARQQGQQTNSFYLASDVVQLTTAAQIIPSMTFATLYAAVVPFPNIPVNQGSTPSNQSPLKIGQAQNITPTGSTALLFQVQGAQCTTNPKSSVVISEFSVTPYVVDNGGIVYKNAYLPPGGVYRTFSAYVEIIVHNPNSTASPSLTATFTINGHLSAGYPNG